MKYLLIFCLVLVFSLTACFTPKPQLTKRYSQIKYNSPSAGEEPPTITITVFSTSTPTSEQQSKSVLNLGDKAQAEFIKLTGINLKNPDDLRTAIFKSFRSSAVEEIDRSRTTLSRRLVFSLQPKGFRPADRIEQVITVLSLPKDIRFISWDQFGNRYKTIKPGSLELEKSNTTNIEGSLSFPQIKELGDISISHELSRKLKESANLDKDIVHFSAQLENNQATLFQKGATSIDLSGTFIVDLVMEFEQGKYDQRSIVKFEKIFNEKGKPASSQDVIAIIRKINYPFSSCEIKGRLEAAYQIRKVVNGESTHTESDDDVIMVVGESRNTGGAYVST